MQKDSKIFVAGHNGMVGNSIQSTLKQAGFTSVITRERSELDLTNQVQVLDFFSKEKPEYVFLAAAKVGGIIANNTYRGQFIYENLSIQTNVIHAAHVHKVKKLLFLGSSCIYPKFANQPIKESELLTGSLEATNEFYAIAKIAGIKLCQAYFDQYDDNFISIMPTNLYGPKDNYDSENSHVLPALIRKFHEAKINNLPQVTLWGTGTPMREFLHVEDLANASIFCMQNYNDREIINIGTGLDSTIKDIAVLVQKTVGYSGEINFDTSKPDGTPRKLLDVSRINSLGWKHTISIEDGIKRTYESFLEELNDGTIRGITPL